MDKEEHNFGVRDSNTSIYALTSCETWDDCLVSLCLSLVMCKIKGVDFFSCLF